MRVKVNKPLAGYGILSRGSIPALGFLEKFKSWIAPKKPAPPVPPVVESEIDIAIQVSIGIGMRVKVNGPAWGYGTLKRGIIPPKIEEPGLTNKALGWMKKRTEPPPPPVIDVIDFADGTRLPADKCSWHPVPEWEGRN